MDGWIKLYRKLLESDMWRNLNSKQRDVAITLLLMVNHQPRQWEHEGGIFKAEPGQIVTSLDSIKKNCAKDVSIQNIRTALLKLEKWGFLTNKSTKTGRLITIVNWRVYQADDEDYQQSNQQRANKELTPNKNNNNKRNIYNGHRPRKTGSYTPEFEEFWKAYPRKVKKREAFKCWSERLEEGVEAKGMILAAENYADECKRNETPEQYIKHPTTFLSADRPFEDYVQERERVEQPASIRYNLDLSKVDEIWLNILTLSGGKKKSGKPITSEELNEAIGKHIQGGGTYDDFDIERFVSEG